MQIMPPGKRQNTTICSVNAHYSTSSTLKHVTTPPPSPPAPKVSLRIPYRQKPKKPNINNTLLMSDPLYRPAKLSSAYHIAPSTLSQSNDVEAASSEKDAIQNRISQLLPERQPHNSTSPRDMGDHNMGIRESRGKRGETRACHPHASRETKDPRRSGSPPSRLQEIYRRREDKHPNKQKVKGRPETRRSERVTKESHQSYLAKGKAGDIRGGEGSESDSPEDIEGKLTGYWDRLDKQEEVVKGNVRDTPRNSSDPFASLGGEANWK